MYIRIQTLCCETRNWAQVHPVSIDHPCGVHTTWLEFTCSKLNWLDMIWKGTHLFGKAHTVDRAYQSKNQAMRSKELSIEVQDGIVSRHRSGEGYQNISAALKISKNTVTSIILKWKTFDWAIGGHSDLPEGQPSLQHSTNQAFMVEWPDRSRSSVKYTWKLTWSLPKGT